MKFDCKGDSLFTKEVNIFIILFFNGKYIHWNNYGFNIIKLNKYNVTIYLLNK